MSVSVKRPAGKYHPFLTALNNGEEIFRVGVCHPNVIAYSMSHSVLHT